MTQAPLPIKIILVDDDDGHAALIERNLRRAGFTNDLTRLKDGQEAIDYFAVCGECASGPNGEKSPASCLVLLDINMPRVDGIEVLRRMKADPRTAMIPIVMLTTTDDPREVARCYELGCSVYVTKPVEYDSFAEAIKRLGLFLQVVKLPIGSVERTVGEAA